MRYLSSVSLALVVLMALACTATPVEKSQPIQSSAAAPTPEPKSAIEQVRVGPYGQFEFLISDDTSLTAYRVKDKLGVDGLESRARSVLLAITLVSNTDLARVLVYTR